MDRGKRIAFCLENRPPPVAGDECLHPVMATLRDSIADDTLNLKALQHDPCPDGRFMKLTEFYRMRRQCCIELLCEAAKQLQALRDANRND